MARPLKDGVDYFPKDVTFYQDYKVRLLRAQFGAKGMYLLDYLLCELYAKNGYFLPWNESVQLLVADAVGCECSPQYISEFILGATKCSFFDKRVLDVFKVLTSAGIQRRYVRMLTSRDEIRIASEYWLLNEESRKDIPAGVLNKLTFYSVKSNGNPVKTKRNPDKTTENPQSKVKESKVKESKVKESKVNKADSPPLIASEIQDEWDSYTEMRKQIRKPLTGKATELAIEKLNKLAPGNYEAQKAILNQSVFNCWQGLFEVKGEESNVGTGFKPSRS